MHVHTVSDCIPDLTLLSSAICPPTPSNRPACTHNVRMYVPASQLTQNTPKKTENKTIKTKTKLELYLKEEICFIFQSDFFKRQSKYQIIKQDNYNMYMYVEKKKNPYD